MLRWLDKIPLYMLVIAALTLGLAPFLPQPHVLEKLQMLLAGSLTQLIDIFDLILHGTPIALLVLKLAKPKLKTPE